MHYIKATDFAINRLKELPLCNCLIKEAHEVLLQSVREQNKSPGEFRHSQNWIGAASCNLQNSRYVPPSVEDIKQAMSDLEKYINEDASIDVLRKVLKGGKKSLQITLINMIIIELY